MRAAALPLLAALAVLAACGNRAQPVSSSAPSVSYRIPGNDVTQANADAARYCQHYGTGSQLENVERASSGNIAVYRCVGAPAAVATAPPPSAQPGYGATLPPAQCADPLHQDRPGGTDYYGPPVPECPPRR